MGYRNGGVNGGEGVKGGERGSWGGGAQPHPRAGGGREEGGGEARVKRRAEARSRGDEAQEGEGRGNEVREQEAQGERRPGSTGNRKARRFRHGPGARARATCAGSPAARVTRAPACGTFHGRTNDGPQGKVPGRAESSAGAECTRRPGAKAGSAPGAQRRATSCPGKASVR